MEITIEYQPILEAPAALKRDQAPAAIERDQAPAALKRDQAPAASGVKSINYDLNYAKQTQFAGRSNKRNFCFNKGLWR
jgi:hypothetical protein